MYLKLFSIKTYVCKRTFDISYEIIQFLFHFSLWVYGLNKTDYKAITVYRHILSVNSYRKCSRDF